MQSRAWRAYEILERRYVEQLTQGEVAQDLGYSLRQLQRHERSALASLADLLSSRYDSEVATRREISETHGESNAAGAASSRDRELKWLQESTQSTPISLKEIVQGALDIMGRMSGSLGVTVEVDWTDSEQIVSVQLTAVRQAVFIMLTDAMQATQNGRVSIEFEDRDSICLIAIRTNSPGATDAQRSAEQQGDLEIARQLALPSGVSLEVVEGESDRGSFGADITFSTMEHTPVLFVDDNADTLELVQRYLAGSPYRFVGVRDPRQVFTVAEQVRPRILVLDVMLPNVDGWELLGRLRGHPSTAGIPVIVCTILPQERLALSLGADAFMPKPVSRQVLLSELDRQLVLPAREYH
jgi:CheY-like chemotaxis protein